MRRSKASAGGRHELGNAESLHFPNDSFDACRSERLFQHLKQPARVLAEMERVTKPGGWIVVLDTDWGTLSIDSSQPEIERVLTRYLAEHALRNGYAGRQLYRLFREGALQNVSVETVSKHVHNYAMTRVLGRLDQVKEGAVHAGVITEDQLTCWHRSLTFADIKNVFFASVNVCLVSGKKA